MQIAVTNQLKRPIFISVLAVILLGISLSLITWQNLRQQRQAIQHHMVLAVRSIAKGLENNLTRSIPIFGLRELSGFMFRTRLFFEEQVERGDLVYLGLFSPKGTAVIVSPLKKDFSLKLPQGALSAMRDNREWHDEMVIDGTSALLFVSPTRSGLSKLCLGKDDRPEPCEPPAFLVLAVNMEEHLALYNDYRRNALLQSAYVLAVALVLWVLSVAYLRRRDQGLRLLQLEKFHSQLLDNMPDGLITVDSSGRVAAANKAAGVLLERSDKELLNARWDDISFESDVCDSSRSISGQQQWTICRYHGKELEVLALPLRDDPAQKLLLLRDRTAIRVLEKDLEEARKLASIGHLAAGLAHEIRNPLSALRGFAQFFTKRLKGEQPAEKYAQTMVREADRLNRVVTDLLFLARPREMEPQPVTLDTMVTDVERLISLDLQSSNITIRTELAAQTIHADQDGLKQVLLNLLLNSLAAVSPQSGEIRITSEAAPGGVWLRVVDNGTGMTDEERESALDPFFTTKAKGTGLGLAIVHTIMRKHGGKVVISSNPGEGTTISLFFPSPDKEGRISDTRLHQDNQTLND